MRDEDTAAPRRRGGKGDVAGGGGARGTKVIKVLCPDALIAAMIGKGGDVRKQIEEDTGCRMKISGREEFFPGTRCRVLVATAPEPHSIGAFVSIVVDRTEDVARRGGEGKGAGHREDVAQLHGKESGEIVVRTAMPHACTGAIIGTRGSRIKELRETTRCKVFVENDAYEGHQMVRLIGTPQAINTAMPQLLQMVDEEMGEDALSQWALHTSFDPNAVPTGKKGKGAGRDGKGPRQDVGRSRSRSKGRHPPRSGKGSGRERSKDPADEFGQEGYGDEAAIAEEHPFMPVPVFGSSMEAIQQLSDEFEPGRLEMDHAISCDLPSDRVAPWLKRRDEFVNHVKEATGAMMYFEQEKGKKHHTITLQGPLTACYAAHLVLMKRYHEDDAREEERQRREEEEVEADTADTGGGSEITDLQNKLADLQKQLAQASRSSGLDDRPRKGGKGGKGGGGKGPPRR